MPVTINDCRRCGSLPRLYPWGDDFGHTRMWFAECLCGTVEDETLYLTISAWNETDWDKYQCEVDCAWCNAKEVDDVEG